MQESGIFLSSTLQSDISQYSYLQSNIVHRYLFEGDLNDHTAKQNKEKSLKPAENIIPRWMPANGTYGLAAGSHNYFLPEVSFSVNENHKILCRFKPMDEGIIFAVQFGQFNDIVLILSVFKNISLDTETVTNTNILKLTLISPSAALENTLEISEIIEVIDPDSFIITEIDLYFSDYLYTALKVIQDNIVYNESELKIPGIIGTKEELPADFYSEKNNKLKITLGSPNLNLLFNTDISDSEFINKIINNAYTAIWNELVLFSLPLTIDIIDFITNKNNDLDITENDKTQEQSEDKPQDKQEPPPENKPVTPEVSQENIKQESDIDSDEDFGEPLSNEDAPELLTEDSAENGFITEETPETEPEPELQTNLQSEFKLESNTEYYPEINNESDTTYENESLTI
jgi:hypothetical protein